MSDKKILVVDDDPDVREAAAQALGSIVPTLSRDKDKQELEMFRKQRGEQEKREQQGTTTEEENAPLKPVEEILAEVKSHISSTQLLAKETARLGVDLSKQIPYEYDYIIPENSPRSSLISSMQTLSNPEYPSADVVYESAETILIVSETLAASIGNVRTVQTIVDLIKAIPDGLPVKGKLVTGFGIRKSPFGNVLQLHRGLDIVAKLNTPVTSGGDGIVVFTGTSYLWGKNIVIDHGFGIFTQYGHLNDIAVKLDDHVRKGETIGKLGKTGRVTGAHLHYQIWVNEIPLDPFMFFAAGEKRHLKIDSPTTTADGSAPQLPEGGSR